MKTSEFDYTLPPELIAQTPIEPRDASRLLALDRSTGALAHSRFRELGTFLRPGDLLVMNDSRVLAGRLKARKETGGAVEVLMLRRRAALTWEVLVGGRGVHLGSKLIVEGKEGLSAVVLDELDGARRVVQFSQPISPLLDAVGEMPLPPYIREPLKDRERYQTVYAKTAGSAAAPTAGLHFTHEMLSNLAAAGVRLAYVTLHIGLATFAPVTGERVEDHPIHKEWCQLPRDTAIAINETRAKGGRVIAVGTTVVRTLESAARASTDSAQTVDATRPLVPSPAGGMRRVIMPVIGNTDLFITPGFKFEVVDAMLTNFHLPRSTLLMLVCAFAGREKILAAYQAAIGERYRFYSFGDAMLIV